LTINNQYVILFSFLNEEDESIVKTTVPKTNSIEKRWYLIDAQGQILGRMASQIATLLRGKHRPQYTPHLDLGDHVVVINADKIKVTGRKLSKKFYTRYTGYPGGLRKIVYEKVMKNRPEKILFHAVKGMLPKNRLGRKMIKKLRIYSGREHPHQAQKPEILPESLRRL